MYFYFYQVFMILSLVISLSLIVLIWRRRHLPAAPAMIALAAGTFVWTLGDFLQTNSNTLALQLLFLNIGYMGLMSVPVAWFVFAINYTNSIHFMRGWRLILVCTVPFLIAVLVWTNNWHHLMWSNEHLAISGSFLVTARTNGPFFWVALAYNYLCIAVGVIILVRRLFVGTPLYTKQALSLIIAVCLPLIWDVIYVFNLVPVPRKDFTPVMFAVSGLAIALGLLRYHLFTTVPFAREFIIQQLNDGVFIFDARNCLVEANPLALKVTGADKSIIGKKLEDLSSVLPLFKEMAGAEAGCKELDLVINGDKRLFELELTPMYIQKEQPAGWLAILHDITERRKSEEQYRLIAENSADIIYKLNIKSDRYMYVSPSVERLLGYTEKEALLKTSKDVLTPESHEKERAALMAAMQKGISSAILLLDVIHKDGHIVPAEVHASMIYDKETGEPVEIVGVVRDITERKKMEEQLIVQDRLASIGQLTSGVAHELNNPLTSVINFSNLLLKRELPEDIRQDITTIYEEAQRTSYIVKSLLTFSQKQAQEKEPVSIIELINKVLELRKYEQRVNNIQVKVHAKPDLPMVMGSSSQLEQVFFNIIINAEFFMLQAHKKGTLTIAAEQAGDYMRVSFADDGPGIPEEDLQHVFAPFFTTKEPGKGTGLSLTICRGIITGHGGKIWAESAPGEGATFIVELPVYKEPGPDEDD